MIKYFKQKHPAQQIIFHVMNGEALEDEEIIRLAQECSEEDLNTVLDDVSAYSVKRLKEASAIIKAEAILSLVLSQKRGT